MLTGDDVPGEGDSGCTRHDEPLFPTEVMFHSQPVAWVLGETLEAARKGAARVIAEYEPLPRDTDHRRRHRGVEFSFRAGARDARRSSGDREERAPVFGRARDRRAGTLLSGNAVRDFVAGRDRRRGGAVLDAASRETQDIVARVLGIARNQVTVECLRMGGAFGGKEVQANAWAAIAALGAWKTKRPVRVRLTRALDMALTGKRHPFLARYRAGFTRDGRLEGVRIEFYLRRRLEPGSIRPGSGARHFPCRQRLSAARGRLDRLRLPHAQDIANGIPRIRRTAGDAGDRRHHGSGGAAAGAAA